VLAGLDVGADLDRKPCQPFQSLFFFHALMLAKYLGGCEPPSGPQGCKITNFAVLSSPVKRFFAGDKTIRLQSGH
jgi:hypothetical protein